MCVSLLPFFSRSSEDTQQDHTRTHKRTQARTSAHARTHANTPGHTHRRTHSHTHARTSARTHEQTLTHTYAHTHTRAHMHNPQTRVRTHARKHVRTRARTHTVFSGIHTQCSQAHTHTLCSQAHTHCVLRRAFDSMKSLMDSSRQKARLRQLQANPTAGPDDDATGIPPDMRWWEGASVGEMEQSFRNLEEFLNAKGAFGSDQVHSALMPHPNSRLTSDPEPSAFLC